MKEIKIGIVGYGNLGRGVEAAIQLNPDIKLMGIFTRRAPDTIKPLTGVKVYPISQAAEWKDKVDVMILCGGSATDLPKQGVEFAHNFNIVDSFDTHAKIPEYFAAVDAASAKNGKTAIISVGWDPGLFSLNRLYAEAVLPEGNTYTFWGKGVSQGHSDAIRHVAGVKNAIQYTVPVEKALEQVRGFQNPELSTRDKHRRDCFVVAEEGADLKQITADIQNMPNYFSEYDTTVTFISEAEFSKTHSKMPHGGFVLRTGKTGQAMQSNQLIEYGITLDSNPEFTSSVLVAYARAASRLAEEKQFGAKTVFDIAPSYLSPRSAEALRAELL